MLDFWQNAEPFLKVLYIVILICIPLLFLSIYKIWRWTKRENVAERFRQHRENQQKNAFYELYRRTGRARFIWYGVGCTAVILLATMLPKGWQVIALIAGLIVLYLVNNWIVALHWRCPMCGERLPCIVGRSALRPKWTESCLHCSYGNSQDISSQ